MLGRKNIDMVKLKIENHYLLGEITYCKDVFNEVCLA